MARGRVSKNDSAASLLSDPPATGDAGWCKHTRSRRPSQYLIKGPHSSRRRGNPRCSWVQMAWHVHTPAPLWGTLLLPILPRREGVLSRELPGCCGCRWMTPLLLMLRREQCQREHRACNRQQSPLSPPQALFLGRKLHPTESFSSSVFWYVSGIFLK